MEAGRGDKVAFHWAGEEGETRDVTYAELLDTTERLANVLRSRGISEGDVVGIFLPMVPEVAAAMLACARIGAIHNVVFGGFSVESVCERMEVSEAKALITAAGARRKGKVAETKARSIRSWRAPSIETVIVVPDRGRHAARAADEGGPRPALRRGDRRRRAALRAAPTDGRHAALHPLLQRLDAKPKGILHGTGGYLTGVAWTFRHQFDLKDDDVYFCSADVGWVTGHSYMVYGPLINGATSVMYEGAPDYPHKGIWWELIERYRATIFYTAPTAIRACMKWGAELVQQHDRSSLRLLGTVGEPINPKAWHWYSEVVGEGRCPIVDTWWQTETGHTMVTTLPGVDPARPGSCGRPLPGSRSRSSTRRASPSPHGTQGLLTITKPWPGMLQTLYGDDDRYVSTYFEQFGKDRYVVGDFAQMDPDGYLWVIGRADDVIKVSGHRLSTAEVESALVSHPAVAEAAVVGMHDEDTGQAIAAFVTLEDDDAGDASDELVAELREHVAERIGKLARPKAHLLHDRPSQDALRQDHAPHPAQPGRGQGPRRHLHAARPRDRRRDRRAGARLRGAQRGGRGGGGPRSAAATIAACADACAVRTSGTNTLGRGAAKPRASASVRPTSSRCACLARHSRRLSASRSAGS